VGAKRHEYWLLSDIPENRKISGVFGFVMLSERRIVMSSVTRGFIFQATRPGGSKSSLASCSAANQRLIRRVRRAVIARKRVQVFKSHLDARYAGLFSVSSHDGVTVEAEPVDSAEEIARRLRADTEVVAIDEAQFLDDGIIDTANRLASNGVRVILAGTDVDFRGLPFGPMPTLMCIAEVVDKFQAICVVCGGWRRAISASSTASPPLGTRPQSWLVAGKATKPVVAIVTVFPDTTKIKPLSCRRARSTEQYVPVPFIAPCSVLPAPC
jgi:thymidine kinase